MNEGESANSIPQQVSRSRTLLKISKKLSDGHQRTQLSLSHSALNKSNTSEHVHFFKVVFLGPQTTGKTSIIRQYTHGVFFSDKPEELTTFGLSNYVKNIEKNGKHIKLTIWDTPNYFKFQPQIEKLYDSSDAIVFVHDKTKPEILEDTEKIMIEVAERLKKKKRNVLLVSLTNRKDSTYSVIKDAKISKVLIQKYNIVELKVDASNRDRVRYFFDQMLEILVKKEEEKDPIEKSFYEEEMANFTEESDATEAADDKRIDDVYPNVYESEDKLTLVGRKSHPYPPNSPPMLSDRSINGVRKQKSIKIKPIAQTKMLVLMENQDNIDVQNSSSRNRRSVINPCCSVGNNNGCTTF